MIQLAAGNPPAPWRLPEPLPPTLGSEMGAADLPLELLAVLARRGIRGAEVGLLLDPPPPPATGDHFSDLAIAVERLRLACEAAEMVAVCGDYDADGMTSTALLCGVLQQLGARPVAAIPSRQDDGYGLNRSMVERLAADGTALLITVDNGVSAREALDRARELGVEVILTDHHTLPAELPPCLALLHPALTPAGSPFRTLAGVGLAFVLAEALCRRCGHRQGLESALHLFCIGTVADMAPLTGVNRRWLIDGLAGLADSRLPGLRALQQVAGLEGRPLDAEAIAFQIAPRINAVGRLGDPALVVDLLTTSDLETARQRARRCEELNRQRKELCQAIEAEAMALVDADGPEPAAFLLLAQNHWHHGVIGIVAARLVERYGRPVALLADEGHGCLRASVRAPLGFAVDRALHACGDLLERFGGHPAAGGFTVQANRLTALHSRLEEIAGTWLREGGGASEIAPEAHLNLATIDRPFWVQMQRLAPYGIGHPAPLFWTRGCEVRSARLLRGGHLQCTLAQGEVERRAIAWRWQGETPEGGTIDVAYRLRLDTWQDQERLQLEITALRRQHDTAVMVQHRGRCYQCWLDPQHMRIRNAEGEELAFSTDDEEPSAGEGRHPYIQELERLAKTALGLLV